MCVGQFSSAMVKSLRKRGLRQKVYLAHAFIGVQSFEGEPLVFRLLARQKYGGRIQGSKAVSLIAARKVVEKSEARHPLKATSPMT